MRDVNRQRVKPTISKRQYAIAYPAVVDDMDSCDADDEVASESNDESELESDQEFILVSSPNSQDEPKLGEKYENEEYSSAAEDSTSSLNIIEDYFDNLPLPYYQRFDEVIYEGNETEEDSPPAIRLNFAKRLGTPMEGEIDDASPGDNHTAEDDVSLALEQILDLREGTLVLQLNTVYKDEDDLSDSWSVASDCCSDGWAFDWSSRRPRRTVSIDKRSYRETRWFGKGANCKSPPSASPSLIRLKGQPL
ncbi:hypothetical protein PG994_011238 [Apiospora phragmitis]|uniref:Uncharacterized protein n=1 Tax=Apiospora phragmitis TaxID=2905665 RepID=A0ABR1TSF3_9PEZI